MKKHNAVKVVLITLLIILVLSWIFPAAYYSSEYVSEGRIQMGLFDLFNYPTTALSYFGYIAVFFVLVGGFYGILHKIPAYRTFLDKIVAVFDGKEIFFISIVMIIIAVLVSVCGVHYEMFIFFPLIVALILLMGYDKIVAAITMVGSICVGLAGSTYAYNNLNVLISNLNMKIDYEIGVRSVILLVGLVLLIFNTILYINKTGKQKPAKVELKKEPVKAAVVEEKVETKTTKSTKTSSTSSKKKTSTTKKSTGNKKSTTKSKSSKRNVKAAVTDEDVIVVKENSNYFIPNVSGKSHKIWPLVLLFTLMFIVFVLAFIPWNENVFNISFFTDITKNVTEFKIFKFALFGKILGKTNAFGSWTITDFYLVMAFFVLLVSVIYKVKIDDIFDGFAEGAKKALVPAIIVILVYTILVIVTYHPFQLSIYKSILGITKGFNVATTACVAIIASVLNADASYVFQSVLPYLSSLKINNDLYGLVGIIFQSLYGLTMLVAPTSIVLLSVLSALNISYKEWLGKIWKFLIEFFVVLLIIFIILAVI